MTAAVFSRSARRRLLAVTSITLLLHTLLNVTLNVAAASELLVVTTVADTPDASPGDGLCADAGGACSLRAAVEEAEGLAGADTITFNVSDGSIIMIDPGHGPLPDITEQVTIDGTTDPTFIAAGHPVLTVDADAVAASPVITVDAAGSVLQGLVLLGGQGVAVTADDVALSSMVVGSSGASGVLVDRGARPTIADSWIGVGPDGSPLANVGDGIRLGKFVADGSITGNVIAGNGTAGVALVPNTAAGNTIVGNIIMDNGTQAIDLNANDRADTGGDGTASGPNDLQSFPVFTVADHSPGSLAVTFTVDSPPGVYLVDIYSTATPDPGTGNGELEVFLGSVEVALDGSNSPVEAALSLPDDVVVNWVTGTATVCLSGCTTLGSTSEAGPTFAATPIIPPSTTSTTRPTTTSTSSTNPTSTSTTEPTSTSTSLASSTTVTPSTTSTTVASTVSVTTAAPTTTGTSTTITSTSSSSTSSSSTSSSQPDNPDDTADDIDSLGQPPDNLAMTDDNGTNDGTGAGGTGDEAAASNPNPSAVQEAAAALLASGENSSTSRPPGDKSGESGLLALLLAIAEMVQNARPPLWPYYMAAMLLVGLELLAWFVVPRQAYYIADHAFGVTLGGEWLRPGSGPYWGRAHRRNSSTVDIEGPSGGVNAVLRTDVTSRRF